jgi:hypothetical protein
MGNMEKEATRHSGSYTASKRPCQDDVSIANGYPVGALRSFCAAWAALWAFITVFGLLTGAI